MRAVIIFLFLYVFASGVLKPQEGPEHGRPPHKKLEQLEQIKLIETLNMDEETTLKFFSRRSSHKENMRELTDQLDNKSKEIEKMIKNKADDTQLKQSVKQFLDLESRIPQQRAEFINSLTDILSQEQIAKLVIFEKMFREEVRQIIFRERGKRRD